MVAGPDGSGADVTVLKVVVMTVPSVVRVLTRTGAPPLEELPVASVAEPLCEPSAPPRVVVATAVVTASPSEVRVL